MVNSEIKWSLEQLKPAQNIDKVDLKETGRTNDSKTLSKLSMMRNTKNMQS